jgi:hypothetical protein
VALAKLIIAAAMIIRVHLSMLSSVAAATEFATLSTALRI